MTFASIRRTRRRRSSRRGEHGFTLVEILVVITIIGLIMALVGPRVLNYLSEAKAKAAGYEVRRTKIEGSCYEVYGVKEGKLFELFYSPEDLSLKHTIAK